MSRRTTYTCDICHEDIQGEQIDLMLSLRWCSSDYDLKPSKRPNECGLHICVKCVIRLKAIFAELSAT